MIRSEATLAKYSSGPNCVRFVAGLETVANDELYLASGSTIVDWRRIRVIDVRV